VRERGTSCRPVSVCPSHSCIVCRVQTAKDITKQCTVLLPKYDYCDSDTETHKAAVFSLPFSVSLESDELNGIPPGVRLSSSRISWKFWILVIFSRWI